MENKQDKDVKKKEDYRYQRAGGLWKKQTKDGRGYLSGRITLIDEFGLSKDYSISVWPSRTKVAGDTKFDYTIDIDTQATKEIPAKSFKKPSIPALTTSPASQEPMLKAESLMGNPFDKESGLEKVVDRLL